MDAKVLAAKVTRYLPCGSAGLCFGLEWSLRAYTHVHWCSGPLNGVHNPQDHATGLAVRLNSDGLPHKADECRCRGIVDVFAPLVLDKCLLRYGYGTRRFVPCRELV